MIKFQNDLQRNRTLNSVWVVLLLFVAVGLFLWSPSNMRLYDPQAGDLGIDILQPAVVAIIYVCIGTVFSTLLTTFVESTLKAESFSPWLSRYAVLFILFLSCFCGLAAAIL